MRFFSKKECSRFEHQVSSLPLDKLFQLKQVAHVSRKSMKKTIDVVIKHIDALKGKLAFCEETKSNLVQTRASVILFEEERYKGLVDSQEDGSADNYLVRAHFLMHSPLRTYQDSLEDIERRIAQLMKGITEENTKLRSLNDEKKIGVTERRIINQTIDRKQQEAAMPLGVTS